MVIREDRRSERCSKRMSHVTKQSASNPYNGCTKTNIVNHADAKTVGATWGARIKLTWPVFALDVIFAALGAAGCEGTHPGHGPYYGAPYYGGSPDSDTISDRPSFYPPGIRRSF